MARKRRPTIVVTLDRLDPKGPSGLDAQGRRWRVRTGAVGAVVRVQPGRKGTARRIETVTPAPDAVVPRCPVYGRCGGCQLQEMPLVRQRQEKAAMVRRLVASTSPAAGRDDAAAFHAPTGAPAAYGYRNKLELSWGTRAYWADAEKERPKDGHFLGFHPPGWFSRIVPVASCPLASPAMNAVIEAVADLRLAPAWDNQAHTGIWRHLVLREGSPDPQGNRLLVTLVTSSSAPARQVEAVAERIVEAGGVRGVLWVSTDRLSEVAQGEVRAVLHGSDTLQIALGPVQLELPHDAFFQVNTEGAKRLFATIAEALGEGGTLFDLYCGVGAIGLYVGRSFDEVVGIEQQGAAIEVARTNAARAGVRGRWFAGTVEALLPELLAKAPSPLKVVVDPPRAGLQPKAARVLARLDADALVYVACNPVALARDRAALEAGGWRLVDVWTVDLFPQTRHVEAVARFVRRASLD